jgi:catechol 2,3-dioxygenase-like lactoylglutathione lyase family enzyme
MTLPPQPSTGIGHVGILVADLRGEVERYGELLGVRFRPPAPLVFDVVETDSGTEYDVAVGISYAPDGPPYFELLQATGDTVWTPAQGHGLHHIGGHVPDIAAEERRLEALGMRVEARIRTHDGLQIISFLQPTTGESVRVELLSEVLYPAWRNWMTGGPPPGHDQYPDA